MHYRLQNKGGLHPVGSVSEGSAFKGGLHPGVMVCIQGGFGRPPPQELQDTVNKRGLRILLECFLIFFKTESLTLTGREIGCNTILQHYALTFFRRTPLRIYQ